MSTVLGGHVTWVLVIATLLALAAELVLITRGASWMPHPDGMEPDPYLWSLYMADADPYIWSTYATPEYAPPAVREGLCHSDPPAQHTRAAS